MTLFLFIDTAWCLLTHGRMGSNHHYSLDPPQYLQHVMKLDWLLTLRWMVIFTPLNPQKPSRIIKKIIISLIKALLQRNEHNEKHVCDTGAHI